MGDRYRSARGVKQFGGTLASPSIVLLAGVIGYLPSPSSMSCCWTTLERVLKQLGYSIDGNAWFPIHVRNVIQISLNPARVIVILKFDAAMEFEVV
jgi:hypothetical protein